MGVARHGTKVFQLVLDGVLHFLPFLRVGVAVDEACGLVDVGLSLCRIVEGEGFGEVVTQLIVTRPVPLLRVGRNDVDNAAALVAHFSLRIVAVHLGVEDDTLGSVVEVDVLDNLESGFRSPLGFGKGLNGFWIAGVVVTQTAPIGLHYVGLNVGVLLEGFTISE